MELKGNLEKEYNDFYTNKEIFEEYYKGNLLQEFIELPPVVYNEWSYWKNEYSRRIFERVEKHTFDIHFQNFKDYWQYGTPETAKVFEEMKLLSDTLLREWRYKYTLAYPDVYENEHYMPLENMNKENKTKAEQWDEFKMIWDLDPEDYSEILLDDCEKIINAYMCDYDTKFFDDYPQTFWEYRENANYHSFDEYSVLKQFKVCEEWQAYLDKNEK